MAAAQVREPQKKSEITIGQLDVIYDEEEYRGMPAEQEPPEAQEPPSHIYRVPFVLTPEEDEEEDPPQRFDLTDDGVDSEEDILLEGFDTMAIHLPKLNPASITEPIELSLSDFTWPTPTSARPSSHFGPRRRRFHYGLDLAQPTGEPIYAAFDGVVRISKYNRSYGNLVIIHHTNGLETYYAHMSKRLVVSGEHVKSGQQIGLCGNTGRSFGSHLHFEIRYMGNAINPENVMDCSTHDLISHTLELTAKSFRKVAKGGTGKATSSGDGWYRVRQGDTLEKIARRNGTTVKRLCQLNGISQNKVLRPGDRLKVSGGAASSSTKKSSSKSSQSATHTVRRGETLSSIARANGTTVKAICQLNGISQNSVIREGQKLKVR
ncbi:MAG: peptidoglycan DD-metalloendopeptidase family protein [Bacteroidales bacterium]|nr:peptidoglycan DD-metalloendopeptidase family protein [Bacteroidales bacterium]